MFALRGNGCCTIENQGDVFRRWFDRVYAKKKLWLHLFLVSVCITL